MKHQIVLVGLFVLTLIAAALVPSLVDYINGVEQTTDEIASQEMSEPVDVPVEIEIPIVAYEDAVGDPLSPELISLAEAARRQSLSTAPMADDGSPQGDGVDENDADEPLVMAVESLTATVASTAAAVMQMPTIKPTTTHQLTMAGTNTETHLAASLENLNNSTESAETVIKQWYINAAVFSGQPLAQQLVDRLQDQGFSPAISEQETNGKVFYRVMLGPYQHRTEANGVVRHLVDSVGITGTVLQF